jgi:hypothetical protein
LIILEISGLDKITLRQVSALYWELRSLLGNALHQRFVVNESNTKKNLLRL